MPCLLRSRQQLGCIERRADALLTPLWLRQPSAAHAAVYYILTLPYMWLSAVQAVKGRPMSQDEVSLLYRVFDTNKDGFLEISGTLTWRVTAAPNPLPTCAAVQPSPLPPNAYMHFVSRTV